MAERNIRNAVITGLLTMYAASAQGPVISGFQRASIFATMLTNVSAPVASPVISRNIGQCMHLIKVEFPLEVAGVSGIQVRLEASYDQVIWFPITQDITQTFALVGGVYAFQKGYGVFPAYRVNSLLATPGGKLMTVRYSGHVLPSIPTIQFFTGDRYTF
jgi:hypothetical protein